MRILHVIPQFPYFGGRTIIGGHASCLLTLALAQAAAGDEVTILSYVEKQAGDIPVEDSLVVHSMSAHARPGTVGHGVAILRDAAAWA
ncbi:MAG: hypothetical protein HKO59_05830, partial [Phycisphaerales bacterium]|nr:hypothetical protein [Phycisphaerales bacterium]